MVTIAVILVIGVLGYKAYLTRQATLAECNKDGDTCLEMIKSHEFNQKDNFLTHYLSLKPSETRQRVLERFENIVVVNFVNHNQALLKAQKLAK